MGFLAVKNTAIRAIYTSVPKQKVFTKDYEWVTIAERDLFAKTTGIIERRVASSTTTCSDLCFQAADELLNDLNCRDQIDLILFVSQSPDYFLPSTAVILQDKLGLSKNTVAFDINLGCSGYVYGLTVIGQFLQNGNFRKALLLCGDKSTISTNYQDKSSFPLFGDAGSATLLEFDKSADEWFAHLASDGSGKDSIIIEHGHSRHPYGSVSDEYIEYEPGVIRTKKHLALNGMDVFNFALKEVAPSIRQMLENFEIKIDDIDHFVLHQANKLINESVRKKLKVIPEKVPFSIQNFGNTSSASIPLTICTCLKEKIESDQLTLLLAGFGVGFSWGSVVLKTSKIRTKIVEHD